MVEFFREFNFVLTLLHTLVVADVVVADVVADVVVADVVTDVVVADVIVADVVVADVVVTVVVANVVTTDVVVSNVVVAAIIDIIFGVGDGVPFAFLKLKLFGYSVDFAVAVDFCCRCVQFWVSSLLLVKLMKYSEKLVLKSWQ